MSRSKSLPAPPAPRMRCAALPILTGSLRRPSRTRRSRANKPASAAAAISAVRAASWRARASEATTMARVPSVRATSVARPRCWGISTEAVSSSMASRASLVVWSRRSLVASTWSNPAAATASALAAEMRPRSATTQMRPTANLRARSSSTAGRVEASLAPPANTWCAIGMPSVVHKRPITIWGRSERWPRQCPNARDGNRSDGVADPHLSTVCRVVVWIGCSELWCPYPSPKSRL